MIGKKTSERMDDDEEVCGNCFWLRYCFSNFKGIFKDSICLFQPSAFTKAIREVNGGPLIFAQGAGFEVLPENFFEEEIYSQRDSQLAIAEKYLLIDALMRKQWSQKRAAEYLGVSQRTINYLCRKHGIRHPHWWKYYPKENGKNENIDDEDV